MTTTNPHTDHPPVTVIGLGLMGHALASAFLHHGHATTVWNRSSAKADDLVDRGATLAESVETAVATSQLNVVCVSDYDTVYELLEPLGDVLNGRVLVNLSSGTSIGARKFATWAEQRGATYLDGAILAVPEGIGADADIIYSGPQSAFDSYESTLRHLGSGTTYLGEDHGLSSLYDVAMLSLMWNILNGFLHGAALVGTAGVDATTFAPFAKSGIETVADWVTGYAQQIDENNYPALDSALDTHVAAMDHLVDESAALGIDTQLPDVIKALAERALADGDGDQSYAALIKRFREPSHKPV